MSVEMTALIAAINDLGLSSEWTTENFAEHLMNALAKRGFIIVHNPDAE